MSGLCFDSNKFVPEAAVIGNGEFPRRKILDEWLKRVNYTACCDGAADRFLSLGRIPNLIIGDCDSLSAETERQYEHLICRIPEQETNDQTKAVRYLASNGFRKIVILGATGRREDHTLGNISLLVYYLKFGVTAVMPTDSGIFIPCRDTMKFSSFVGQQISIFRFGARCLRAENLRYSLHNFDMFWQGTLNEATADEFSVFAKGYYLVYMAY